MILTGRSRGKASVARNVASCSHVSFMRALLKIRRVSNVSSSPPFPSFQRSHDSLISCTCFGGKGNRVYLRFFSFFRLFYLIPFPPSSPSFLFSIKRRGTVSDRHADRERSGRDVGCEQPRVQLPGKGFQG